MRLRRWRRRQPVVVVTIGLASGGKITAPVDAIDWASYFGVSERGAA